MRFQFRHRPIKSKEHEPMREPDLKTSLRTIQTHRWRSIQKCQELKFSKILNCYFYPQSREEIFRRFFFFEKKTLVPSWESQVGSPKLGLPTPQNPKILFSRMTSQIESNEVIDRLVEADPTLSQFLNDDFQSEEYAMKIVTSEVVSDVLDSLNKDRFQNY